MRLFSPLIIALLAAPPAPAAPPQASVVRAILYSCCAN